MQLGKLKDMFCLISILITLVRGDCSGVSIAAKTMADKGVFGKTSGLYTLSYTESEVLTVTNPHADCEIKCMLVRSDWGPSTSSYFRAGDNLERCKSTSKVTGYVDKSSHVAETSLSTYDTVHGTYSIKNTTYNVNPSL